MDNPLTGMEPPTESIAPWWPLVGVAISMLVAAVSAMWAAWMQFRQWRNAREEKVIDKEKEQAIQQEQRKQAVEIEELKLSFDQRQKLLETLQAQLKEQLEEGRLMRKELADARAELVKRDAEYAARDAASRAEVQSRDKMVAELQTTIVTLNLRINHLEKEMKQMEQSQNLHLRQAHATGVTTP